MRRHERGERGAAAIEFAILLPVLLVLLFGIIEFGLVLSTKISLTQAVREGARLSSFPAQTDGDVRQRVQDAATPVAVTAGSISRTACPNAAGVTTVTVNHTYTLITPIGVFTGIFAGQGAGGTVTLNASGVMRCGA